MAEQSNRQLTTTPAGVLYRTALFHFRGPTSRYWVLTKGYVGSLCRFGDCGNHPIFMAQDPVRRDPSPFHLRCLVPRDPQHLGSEGAF